MWAEHADVLEGPVKPCSLLHCGGGGNVFRLARREGRDALFHRSPAYRSAII